jgi:3D (Asp-Asp-Asp) domain-containing protein
MRIIGIMILLPILLVLSVPQNVLAAENNTDETKINANIQTDVLIVNGEVYENSIILASAPYNSDDYEPVKPSRDDALARYKKKTQGQLPEGKFEINASAYTAAADECGKSDGITASGLKVMENRTLACPPQFVLGTKIKIDGMGTYVCEDRGGAIKVNHFDIYMQTKKQAFAFGRRTLLAEVIK